MSTEALSTFPPQKRVALIDPFITLFVVPAGYVILEDLRGARGRGAAEEAGIPAEEAA